MPTIRSHPLDPASGPAEPEPTKLAHKAQSMQLSERSNVDGIDHQKEVWSFKMVITGLYDRFVHNGAVSTAADKFWNATYVQEEGIMAFYHKLMRHAARMVRPPDRYTFKSHLVARMPGNMFNYLLSKEVTAEYSMVEAILHYARRVEENARQRARWSEER